MILPGYTEEYPVYNEYLFNTTEIKYQENLTVTDFQCFKSTDNKFIGIQKGENVEFKANDCILKKEVPDIIVGRFNSADLQKISKTEIPQKIKIPNNHNIESFTPLGMFTIDAIVESVTSPQNIKLKFNFYFKNEYEMVLNISTEKSEEVYCEGKYKLTKSKKIIKAKFNDEGICTDNAEESNFYIKNENSKIYIKTRRFANQDWQELIKK